jgi:hypothetical protein
VRCSHSASAIPGGDKGTGKPPASGAKRPLRPNPRIQPAGRRARSAVRSGATAEPIHGYLSLPARPGTHTQRARSAPCPGCSDNGPMNFKGAPRFLRPITSMGANPT